MISPHCFFGSRRDDADNPLQRIQIVTKVAVYTTRVPLLTVQLGGPASTLWNTEHTKGRRWNFHGWVHLPFHSKLSKQLIQLRSNNCWIGQKTLLSGLSMAAYGKHPNELFGQPNTLGNVTTCGVLRGPLCPQPPVLPVSLSPSSLCAKSRLIPSPALLGCLLGDH